MFFVKIGMKINTAGLCLYGRHTSSLLIIIPLYVHGLLITSNLKLGKSVGGDKRNDWEEI